jgi:hypothetical protein
MIKTTKNVGTWLKNGQRLMLYDQNGLQISEIMIDESLESDFK